MSSTALAVLVPSVMHFASAHTPPAVAVAAAVPQTPSTSSVQDVTDLPPRPRSVPSRASRDDIRRVLPKVTCWTGKVVIDHPNVQDCPSRPKPKPAAVHSYAAASVSSGAYAWAHTYFAIRVANCESGGGASDHSSTYDGDAHMRGFYSGKWQMNPEFWSTYGGRAYAATPADASESAQDAVAYRGYLARGWQPWQCAGMV